MGIVNRGLPPIYSQPSTEWFNDPVTKDSGVAPTPGTIDFSKAAVYGLVNIPQDCALSAVHLHLIEDGSSGSFAVEVYRKRSSVFTRIGTGTIAAGGGDDQRLVLTLTDSALLAWDYLYMQLTAKMAGGGVGFVDVHFDPVQIAP